MIAYFTRHHGAYGPQDRARYRQIIHACPSKFARGLVKKGCDMVRGYKDAALRCGVKANYHETIGAIALMMTKRYSEHFQIPMAMYMDVPDFIEDEEDVMWHFDSFFDLVEKTVEKAGDENIKDLIDCDFSYLEGSFDKCHAYFTRVVAKPSVPTMVAIEGASKGGGLSDEVCRRVNCPYKGKIAQFIVDKTPIGKRSGGRAQWWVCKKCDHELKGNSKLTFKMTNGMIKYANAQARMKAMGTSTQKLAHANVAKVPSVGNVKEGTPMASTVFKMTNEQVALLGDKLKEVVTSTGESSKSDKEFEALMARVTSNMKV